MHKNILILIVLSTTLFSAVNYEEIVYLKDGSEIHGVIIEQVPNQYIKIKSGKNIFVYQIDEIEKITKSEIKESDSYNDNSYEKTKGTEDWYFTFGLGPSLTNNTIFDDSDVTSIGMNILGFYWHNSPKSILGFSISGKSDRYESPHYYYYDSWAQLNLYLYSLSEIRYSETFGQGTFLRWDIGLSRAISQVGYSDFEDDSYSDTESSDWGIGYSIGGGYSHDFNGKTRLLVGLYWTGIKVEDIEESYLNIIFTGLF